VARRRVGVGQIIDVQGRALAELFDDVAPALLIAPMHQHARAFLDAPRRDRLADAGGGAGDDDGFVLESHGIRTVARCPDHTTECEVL